MHQYPFILETDKQGPVRSDCVIDKNAGIFFFHLLHKMSALVAQSELLTGDHQEFTDLISTGAGTILSWRSIIKYFLQSFSPSTASKGQLSVSGERIYTSSGYRLED